MIGIFLDTETNGLNFIENKILEIAFCLVDLNSLETLFTYSTIIHHSKEIFLKSDPQSLYINGFTYDMIESGKPEEAITKELRSIFRQFKIRRDNAVFICQNPSFDRAFFSQLLSPYEQEKMQLPYHWLDFASMFFMLELTLKRKPWEIGLSKDKIAKYLQLPEEKRPHKALNGVLHLIDCFKKTLTTYTEKK